MAFKTPAQIAQDKIDRGEIPGRHHDYFNPPFGGRPPSDAAVHAATVRYVEWGRRNGITPSPEWERDNSPATTPAAAEKGRERASSRR